MYIQIVKFEKFSKPNVKFSVMRKCCNANNSGNAKFFLQCQ